MTPTELRNKGYQILVEHLGQVDTILFLQQAGWGIGNYTQEREETLKTVTREGFWQDIKRMRKKNKDEK